MSAYEEYLAEKNQIDQLLRNGFIIAGIREGLDGTDVRFKGGDTDDPAAEVRLRTADARKYVSSLIYSAGKQI